MNPQAAPDYFELSDYVTVLRRRWRTIAVWAVAGLVLAGLYLVVGPKKYTATVLVQVNALPNNANAVGGRTGGPVNMDNEGQAVQSAAVVAIVQERIHSTLSVTDLVRHIHVTVPPNSTYLQITCDSPSALTAQQCANATGKAYLYNRRARIDQVLSTGIKALQAHATRLRGEIERLKTLLFETRHKKGVPAASPVLVGDALQLTAAQTEFTSVQASIDTAVPLLDSMAAAGSVISGYIATPAALPTAPSSPRKLLVIPSGLIAGLILGLALAFLRDRRDKHVHSARDVERLGGLPTLLNLAVKGQRPVTTLESPRSDPGRAFGELAQYASAALGAGSHALAVTATSSGSGGSIVAANLAAALARTTDETVLICGDLQGTRVPELLGIARGRGLSELLAGAAEVSELLRQVADRPRLGLLAPGFEAERAVTAMQHAKVQRIISELLDHVRYVVIEVQSVGENSDTFTIAQFAEAAIVVVEAERSRPADIADCVRRLGLLGTSVLGTAVIPGTPTARKSQVQVQAQGYSQSQRAPLPQDRSDLGASKRYDMQPDRGPGQQAPIWTASSPKVSGSQQRTATAAAPRNPKETWPMPRVAATERDGFPNPADPATGD
jgi:capsular polysaccharide biosynthesis protein/Mrp family chromosome partitioning ATPase